MARFISTVSGVFLVTSVLRVCVIHPEMSSSCLTGRVGCSWSMSGELVLVVSARFEGGSSVVGELEAELEECRLLVVEASASMLSMVQVIMKVAGVWPGVPD